MFAPTTPRLRTRLVAAAAGSLLVHAVFVSGAMRGLADVFRWHQEAEPVVLQARIVTLAPPEPPRAATAKPKPDRKPKPKSAPASRPVISAAAGTASAVPAAAPEPANSASTATTPGTPVDVPAAAPPPLPEPPPAPPRPLKQSPYPARASIAFELTLEANNYKVWATQTWEAADGRYRIFLSAEAKALFFTLGALSMESQGVITGDGLRPERYVDERNKRRTVVSFSANEKSATVDEANGNRKTVALIGQAADVMSLTFDLGFNPDIAVGSVFTLSNRDNVEEIRLIERRDETLALETGALVTRFYDFRRPGGGGGMQVWLAVERQWLPAKIRILGRDGAVTMVATRFEIPAADAK